MSQPPSYSQLELTPSPDNRKRLLDMYDFHTLLRLPTDFHQPGVKASAVPTAGGRPKKPWTKTLGFTIGAPTSDSRCRLMKAADLDDFIACYKAGDRRKRKESERFRKFAYADLIKPDR